MSRAREGAPEHLGNLVIDLDGVVYLGSVSVPGAGAALSELSQRGYHLVFATNASMRTTDDVAEVIHTVTGFPALNEQVVTSGVAAAGMLGPDDFPVLVIGEAGLVATLERLGAVITGDPRAARSVVVGLDRDLRYAHLRDAARAVMGGARLIATNTDPTYPLPDGLWPGCGAIVAAIETASGRTAEVAGKPHSPMRAVIRGYLVPGPTWVVGDRPETDVALARLEGWGAILVLTGIVSDPAQVPPNFAADHVLASIAQLPGLLP
jgi:HAD superfamily hydrolase (TIGR01450 family)